MRRRSSVVDRQDAPPIWGRAIPPVSQRLPHSRRYRRQLPSPTSPRTSLFSQARRRRRQYLVSYCVFSITPCAITPSRVRGAAEAAERAKTLMPAVIIVPRTIDRITPPWDRRAQAPRPAFRCTTLLRPINASCKRGFRRESNNSDEDPFRNNLEHCFDDSFVCPFSSSTRADEIR
jgi:hypothetical protein